MKKLCSSLNSSGELAARLQAAEELAAQGEGEQGGAGSSRDQGPQHPIGPRSNKKDKNVRGLIISSKI